MSTSQTAETNAPATPKGGGGKSKTRSHRKKEPAKKPVVSATAAATPATTPAPQAGNNLTGPRNYTLRDADRDVLTQFRTQAQEAQRLADVYLEKYRQAVAGERAFIEHLSRERKLSLPDNWIWMANEDCRMFIPVREDQRAAIGRGRTFTAGSGF
jgi:hypothetical protein